MLNPAKKHCCLYSIGSTNLWVHVKLCFFFLGKLDILKPGGWDESSRGQAQGGGERTLKIYGYV
jgi:hypothetical protein